MQIELTKRFVEQVYVFPYFRNPLTGATIIIILSWSTKPCFFIWDKLCSTNSSNNKHLNLAFNFKPVDKDINT